MGYTEKDAAQRAESSVGEVKRTFHTARNDAAASGELPERNDNKTSDSEGGGLLNFLFRLAGFGKSDD